MSLLWKTKRPVSEGKDKGFYATQDGKTCSFAEKRCGLKFNFGYNRCFTCKVEWLNLQQFDTALHVIIIHVGLLNFVGIAFPYKIEYSVFIFVNASPLLKEMMSM